ncbi:NfeD family protein [Rheinheimera sp. MMS21-TC3]|uniref:NfeD family protein n=1 Tax=Rheinheimera sp. MMS21-TC3 TaxID=3072790 RepID=UPI0028C39DAE|nr:NfeD family protein [Rheinheimera sp. MMS21-TC3]WNO59559.1 NfeD family protein [Rheinheimera sp. MMS21-TC3]
MNIATLWIIAGIVLILSELMATSIVAVFLGVAAIIVGLLLNYDIISSYSLQFLIFAVLSLAMLFSVRSHCKRWFVGYTADSTEQPSNVASDIGVRVIVHSTFEQGAGRVVLNGVQWDAESNDPLQAGDVAWVIANQGIKLQVSANKPN